MSNNTTAQDMMPVEIRFGMENITYIVEELIVKEHVNQQHLIVEKIKPVILRQEEVVMTHISIALLMLRNQSHLNLNVALLVKEIVNQ